MATIKKGDAPKPKPPKADKLKGSSGDGDKKGKAAPLSKIKGAC